MAWVWVSIGSNIDRERNVSGAVTALRASFGELCISPVYETPAEGFDGDPFYNLVVGFDTERTPQQLYHAFRAIEHNHGRIRGGEKFASRSLDIDLLTYDDQVSHDDGIELPRSEIERYAFVLRPLADVAPDESHPVSGETYGTLWQRFRAQREGVMSRVELPL